VQQQHKHRSNTVAAIIAAIIATIETVLNFVDITSDCYSGITNTGNTNNSSNNSSSTNEPNLFIVVHLSRVFLPFLYPRLVRTAFNFNPILIFSAIFKIMTFFLVEKMMI
jgi:hypothetical protein